MHRTIRVVLAPLLFSLSAGVAAAQGGSPPKESRVSLAYGDDPEIVAATRQAHATLGELLARLKDPSYQDGWLVAIKVPMGKGDDVEHVWLGDLVYDGETFAGVLLSQPMYVDFRAGDTVTGVKRSDITDWMAMSEERFCAGFTQRVLVAREDARARAMIAAHAPNELCIPNFMP